MDAEVGVRRVGAADARAQGEAQGGKRAAAEAAVGLVEDGMTLGLGTGSTVYWALQALGARVQGGLRVRGVATSRATEALARDLGIEVLALGEETRIDLTIDGADEVSPALDLTKGGGGALLREKLVAVASRQRVVVVDRTKLVDALGRRPVPVEVVVFGWRRTAERIAALGGRPALRAASDGPFVTDEGHYILDCAFGPIERPAALERSLKLVPGVVESGLFVGLADAVLVGRSDGRVERLDRAAQDATR